MPNTPVISYALFRKAPGSTVFIEQRDRYYRTVPDAQWGAYARYDTQSEFVIRRMLNGKWDGVYELPFKHAA